MTTRSLGYVDFSLSHLNFCPVIVTGFNFTSLLSYLCVCVCVFYFRYLCRCIFRWGDQCHLRRRRGRRGGGTTFQVPRVSRCAKSGLDPDTGRTRVVQRSLILPKDRRGWSRRWVLGHRRPSSSADQVTWPSVEFRGSSTVYHVSLA